MDLNKIGKALSSQTRIKIIQLLCEKSLSAHETFKKYNDKFSDSKRRETIYKELEKLLKYGIVKKNYIEDKKKLVYSIKKKKIELKLCDKIE